MARGLAKANRDSTGSCRGGRPGFVLPPPQCGGGLGRGRTVAPCLMELSASSRFGRSSAPIPAFPRGAGEGAKPRGLIWIGGDRPPPSQPSPAKRGKELDAGGGRNA